MLSNRKQQCDERLPTIIDYYAFCFFNENRTKMWQTHSPLHCVIESAEMHARNKER